MLPQPPQLVVLFSLLIYSFGAFAYGVMLAFWLVPAERATWVGNRRSRRFPAWQGKVIGGTITVCSFIWFLANIVAVINATTGSRSYLPQTVVALLALVFPPLIAHTVFLDAAERNRAISTRWASFLGFIYPASAGVIALILLRLAGLIELPAWFFPAIGATIGSLFALVSIYAMLLMRTARRTRPPEARGIPTGFGRWMNALFFFALFIFIALSAAHALGAGLAWVIWPVQTMAQSMPLAFLAVGTYYENRFDFFDVLVKRGLALVATIALLTICLALVVPLTQDVQADMRPWVQALCLSPLALILPIAYRRAGRWLDTRVFGREFSTVDALRHLLTGLSTAEGERDLLERAEARLSEIASARVALDLSAEAAERAATLAASGTVIAAAGRSDDVRERPDAVMLPLWVDGRAAGTGTFHSRASHRPYFSEDRALLALMLDVFGRFVSLVRMQERRQAEEARAGQLSLRASEAELKALRAQINPHFLFNALNSIAGLIPTDPVRADDAIEQLAEVFRYTLRRSESAMSPLQEELEFVRAYLRVEQARFGDRLSFTIDADPGALTTQVPALMLQTLVENAVKHGTSQLREAGRVSIEARLSKNALTVTVEDNGPGDAATKLTAGEGYGLRNVRDRLRTHYGDRAAFALARDEARARTIATLRFPV